MADAPAVIREELMRRLLALKPLLIAQGMVCQRIEHGRRPSWRLRYRAGDEEGGDRRHRSIALAGIVEAHAVLAKLIEWREHDPVRLQRLERRRARELQRLERARHREQRRLYRLLCGGGRRRQRRVLRAYDAALASGPYGELDFWTSDAIHRPDPRPERPRRAKLALPFL